MRSRGQDKIWISNALESRTGNEKKVFGSYFKKAIAEQNTKNIELSPVIAQGSAEKGKEAVEKGLGYCFLLHRGSKHSSTFYTHVYVMRN